VRVHHVQVSCPPGRRLRAHHFAGHLRFHTADPHGNRVEVLAPTGAMIEP